jgi:hypothetical protein
MHDIVLLSTDDEGKYRRGHNTDRDMTTRTNRGETCVILEQKQNPACMHTRRQLH